MWLETFGRPPVARITTLGRLILRRRERLRYMAREPTLRDRETDGFFAYARGFPTT